MLEDSPISIQVVNKIMRKMNKSGAECSLRLSNNIVKMLHAAITYPMRHPINRIIATQIYPNKWKLARVLAFWKSKGSRDDVSNHHPIILLSPVSKIFKQVIHYQINQHIVKHGLWNKDMNTYRENHSTTIALII